MVFQKGLQGPCKAREGFGKATENTPVCSQHPKQQEEPELSNPQSSRAANLCPYISGLTLLTCVILK